MSYDDNGNILSKGDVGTFAYGTTGKPFAISQATLSNSISVGTQTATYLSFDRPSTVTDNGYTLSFTYNGDYDRVKMTKVKNSQTQLTRYYLGGCYELDVKSTGSTEKLYLNGGYYGAPAVLIKQGGNSSVYNIIRDHLGSITHVLNSSGMVMQELSYDAWGRLRNTSTFTPYAPYSELEPYLGRGYCGHEHLTGLGLINMNARLYDPVLGRFLMADPYIQAPDMTQNFNRYSYCLNNPLKYTDRSGEAFGLDDLIVIAGVVVGAYLGGTVANNNQWNPIKWNYSSFWTYAGIVAGGIAGGYAGYGLAYGNLGLSLKAVTPFGAIGINYWKDQNNNNRIAIESNTITGGHWNSREEKAIKKAEETYDKAINEYYSYQELDRQFNTLLSNLTINTNAINYFGPDELRNGSNNLAHNTNRLFYAYNITNIGVKVLFQDNFSPIEQKEVFELVGESIGSTVGGYYMGTAMAGLSSETGPGLIIAGGYGYITGAYMGGSIGRNIGSSLFESWYDLYYNAIIPMQQLQNYTNSLQNYYQPIW